MPPKSKKETEKHQKKVIEDKTFGLKNKNRSTKVQKQVAQLTASVKAGNREQQKKQAEMAQKKSAKQAKLEYEAEMARLFKVAEDKRKQEEAAAAKAKAEAGEEEDKLGPDGEYLWRPEDFEEVVADETRLEEQLEAEREALKGRTDLTPVTEETFRAWREKKIREKEEAEKARVRKAKETGKGLRGWDLWQENADLFVDDDEAQDLYEREESDLEPEDDDEPAAKHVDPTAA